MHFVRNFIKLEAAGGIILIFAAVVAVLLANSPLGEIYADIRKIPVTIRFGALVIDKPFILWVNDGLMAVFFFLVSLELKREFFRDEIAGPSPIILPAAAAVGGMIIPAMIYAYINLGNDISLHGWAIPTATDIAFALGVMALLGSRVPLTLKLLLSAIAIFDDLGAIIIIAFFYTSELSAGALLLALVAIGVLVVLNRFQVHRVGPYILIGTIVWVFVLKSGVHATLAGVATACLIPMKAQTGKGDSLNAQLIHDLHPWVAFGILPLFAFMNAGVAFANLGISNFMQPVMLGISSGLFIGKQIGVFGVIFLFVKTGLTPMPERTSWGQMYGMALLCGIGFTMSLFIGSLAFEHSDFSSPIRLGVFVGSILSALAGYLVLRNSYEALPIENSKNSNEEERSGSITSSPAD